MRVFADVRVFVYINLDVCMCVCECKLLLDTRPPKNAMCFCVRQYIILSDKGFQKLYDCPIDPVSDGCLKKKDYK